MQPEYYNKNNTLNITQNINSVAVLAKHIYLLKYLCPRLIRLVGHPFLVRVWCLQQQSLSHWNAINSVVVGCIFAQINAKLFEHNYEPSRFSFSQCSTQKTKTNTGTICNIHVQWFPKNPGEGTPDPYMEGVACQTKG